MRLVFSSTSECDSSTHQLINSSTHQHINSSTHQLINSSTHQLINSSTRLQLNSKISQLINMTSTKLWLCVSTCFICLHGTDGFLLFMVYGCVFNSTELKDIQFIHTYNFNNDEFLRWDSRVGEWVGYTEIGLRNAERWNKDPERRAVVRAQREAFCKPNIGVWYSNALDKRVEPKVRLTSDRPPGGKHTHMLRCSSYDFYPKLILVTWLRDGEPATSDVTSTEELPDGDWYYQYHSYLEYTPRSGEKISCMVEHPSLTAPKIVHWDDSMPESVKNKVAIGASGLVLGLVLFLSGLIYYQWKRRGRILVPTTN